jgi:branched-chain amino acid transport system substrate-binding protein
MTRVRVWAALGAVVALAIGSVGTTAAWAAKNDTATPWKFTLLADKAGETTSAIPNYADAADLAATKYPNITFNRVPIGLTATTGEAGLLQAAPGADAFIGFPNSAQTTPLGTKIATDLAGKPLITLNADPTFVLGKGPNGAPNIFLSLPIGDEVARDNARYTASLKPKPKNVGLLCVQTAFGTTSCAAAADEFKKLGINVATTQTNGPAATDLTQQVLAFKQAGVDAVQTFTFPNPLSVFVNQMAQNGMTVPINGAQSAPFAVATKSVQPANLAKFYGTDYCVPTALKSAVAKKWVKDYTAKYGYTPTSSSAQVYDGIGFINAAVQAAKSTDPKKLAAAMKSQSYDGVCGTYKADAGNGLWHSLSYIGFNPDGTSKIVKTIQTGNTVAAINNTATTTTTVAPAG